MLIFKTTKAEGIVVGILTPTHQIDLLRMEELIALAHPLAITFHRAFDLIEDKIYCYSTISSIRN
ncbi:copper homeostasis protein CutC [Spiroplasma sp. ald]|uniref:copper homeostasis protein CutC n=1 Tax=Spiroplasma sp. ald TaxID=2490849 RepID=UPI0037DC9D9E